MRAPLHQSRRQGFTLIEVLIALAILAMALTVLLGTQAQSALMTERANRMALAALLTRSKMIDIEGELQHDGFSDMTAEDHGDFRDEGADDMTWESLVEVVEIPPEAEEQFVASVYSELFGEDGEGGSLSGSSSVTSFMPMIVAQVPQFINQLGERMRKVTLTISWDERGGTQTLTVQQYVVNLNPHGEEGEVETVGGGIGADELQALDPSQAPQFTGDDP
jgi:general secretion pathway protein I